MILNEDYFDDLKLTDEDIESSDGIAISHNNEYATPEKWFADMKSRYTHCININFVNSENEKETVEYIQFILKRVKYLFDAYGIEYSDPTLQDGVSNYFSDSYKDCNFLDFYGLKLVTRCDIDAKALKSLSTFTAVILFNLPVIRSYKSACVFSNNIMKCLWNSVYENRIECFYIWDFKRINSYNTNWGSYIFNPIKYPGLRITMTRNTDLLFDWLRLFFPEKDTQTIRDELFDNDKAEYKKLYKYFCLDKNADL